MSSFSSVMGSVTMVCRRFLPEQVVVRAAVVDQQMVVVDRVDVVVETEVVVDVVTKNNRGSLARRANFYLYITFYFKNIKWGIRRR
jgi:hypothetical protein